MGAVPKKFDVYLTEQQCLALLDVPEPPYASDRQRTRAIKGAKRAILKAMRNPISYDDQHRYEHGSS